MISEGCVHTVQEVRWIAPGEAPGDAFAVRETVFVKEQGFSLEIELDEIDAVAHHVVLYEEGRPVACGRLFADPQMGGNTYHVGRVAVLRPLRGTGLGRRVMEEIERKTRALRADRLVLGAQCRAQDFYKKLGYTPFGEVFMDEHCEHIHMEKWL